MVDYRKWDRLNFDASDSDSDNAEGTRGKVQHGQELSHTPGRTGAHDVAAGDARIFEHAEVLRLKGNSLFESGDVPAAMGAYEAQLRLLEGRGDEAALDATRVALLNQASGLIRLQNFGEAEARCTKLLTCSGSTAGRGRDGGGDGDARTRALHFRGFTRLRQGLFEGACSDLKRALAAGDPKDDEARALLKEAEAGAALSSCCDPEAKARALLGEKQAVEAAKYFREAASRARRRCNAQPRLGSEGNKGDARLALARNLRMESVAVSASGDLAAAEMLLRGGLKELRGLIDATDSVGSAGIIGEEGLMLSALGRVLGRQRKQRQAVEIMRDAVGRLENAIAGAVTKQNDGGHKSDDEGAELSPPRFPEASSSFSSSKATTKASDLTPQLARTLARLGSEILNLQSRGGAGKDGEKNNNYSGHRSGAAKADARLPFTAPDEAIQVLERALSLMKAEAADVSRVSRAGGTVVHEGSEEDMRHQVAAVLDSLSEAYARGKHWEKARSSAEQAVTRWRGLGEPLREGAAASLLSLGHILLQLHGVNAGLDEASARWEEAVSFVDDSTRPLEAADVRLKVAGFYAAAARADPSRLESLEAKISGHYQATAALLARVREGGQRTEEGANGTVQTAAVAAPAHFTELAGKEALASEGYAGAVGDNHDEAVGALRKAADLLDIANVSQRNVTWTLRKVGVLQDLALALAKSGEHALSEEKLLDAIAALEQLDDVGTIHRETLTNLHKYLAIARRARGDMLGAKKALDRVESLAGDAGREEAEDLNRLLGHNRISID